MFSCHSFRLYTLLTVCLLRESTCGFSFPCFVSKRPIFSGAKGRGAELFSSSTSSSAIVTKRDEQVQELLRVARDIGQVGADSSEADQERVASLARKLVPLTDDSPARRPLQGVHNLVYSASKGGSSGKIGPFVGKVTQEFGEDGIFYNKAQFGPLEVSLRAECTVKSDTVCAVSFKETTFRLFGATLKQSEVSGGGTWKYLFVGEIVDKDGNKKLVRVMETPSLFIIEQPLL
jgi:hypothetical protein